MLQTLAVVLAVLVAVAAGEDPALQPRPCPASEATCGSKPNILVIMADDAGLSDIGAFDPRGGARRGMATPVLDQLAKDGMIFTDFYAQPSCTPGRVALHTGRLPIRSGLTAVKPPGNGGGLHPAEWTMASVLKQAGYNTYMSGKWHLGESKWSLPINHGFDRMDHVLLHHLGAYTYGMPELYSQTSEDRVERIYEQTLGVLEGVAGGEAAEIMPMRDMTYANIAYLDEQIKDKSIAALQQLAQQEAPFFMSVNWVATHGPNIPHPDFVGASGVKNKYGDKLVEMDSLTGDLLAALDAIDGLRENTLVMFTVDNGPWQDVFPDSGHTPFRGSKGTVREGGLRVPAIFRWPGQIEAGAIKGDITSGLDMMATVARLAGLQLPTQDREGVALTFDSYDLAPLLFEEGGEHQRDRLYYFTEEGDVPSAVRFGEWKAVLDLRGDNGGTPGGEFPAPSLGWRGASRGTAHIPALYNLWEDPQERNDQTMTPLRTNMWTANDMQDAMTDILVSFATYPNREDGDLPEDVWPVPAAPVPRSFNSGLPALTAEFNTGQLTDGIRRAAAAAKRQRKRQRKGKREL